MIINTMIDLDKEFRSTINPIVLNDVPSVTIEEREAVNSLIMSTYEKQDTLSPIPTCSCGSLQNGFNIGVICKVCDTIVERPTEGGLDMRVWIRVPEGVPFFITPVVWNILSNALAPKGGFNLMEWVTNPTFKIPNKISKVAANRIKILVSSGWERGLLKFQTNYLSFIRLLPTLLNRKCDDLINSLILYKDVSFPTHLPLPTKTLLVLENTHTGSYADLNIGSAIDAAKIAMSYSNIDVTTKTDQWLESRAIAVIKSLSLYTRASFKNTMHKKKHWLRGHLFSTRSNFSARGVITSITNPHNYEELRIPWSMGLELLKIHIMNKLFKLGYSLKAAYDLIDSNGTTYNLVLDNIIKEIISECKDIGFPVKFVRYPTLARGSIQTLFITVVKPDPYDLSIEMSVLVLVGPNADFDGDEMTASLVLDNSLRDKAELLRPHYGLHSVKKLFEFSGITKLPDVTTGVISSYINGSL